MPGSFCMQQLCEAKRTYRTFSKSSAQLELSLLSVSFLHMRDIESRFRRCGQWSIRFLELCNGRVSEIKANFFSEGTVHDFSPGADGAVIAWGDEDPALQHCSGLPSL